MSLSLLLALSTACLLRTADDWDRDQDGVERFSDCDDDDPQVGEISWYLDSDGDGFGSGAATVACESPGDDYVLVDGDCGEGAAHINPDAAELCDNVDNDCDGLVDDDDDDLDLGTLKLWYPDSDKDGFGDPEGQALEQCGPEAGYADNAEDCDDSRADVNPDGTEICDAADTDEDCDGGADDLDPDEAGSLSGGLVEAWADTDGDGFGASGVATIFCDSAPSGYASNEGDCDDSSDEVHPGMAEVCFDDVDQDCDDSLACSLSAEGEYLVRVEANDVNAGRFGRAVRVVGPAGSARVVIADNIYESDNGENAGAIFFFAGVSSTDMEIADADAVTLGQSRNDELGYYMADVGNYFAASAWKGGLLNQGLVYVSTAGKFVVFEGEATGDQFGASISFSGGKDTWMAVGAREGGTLRAGTVYLFDQDTLDSGSATPLSLEALTSAEAIIEGDDSADQVGMQTELLDGNGDGLPDLMLGSFAPDLDGTLSNTGAAYIFLDATSLSGRYVASDADNVLAGKAGEKLGGYIGRAGDVDGDGLQDALVCALEASDGSYSEAGYCAVAFGDSGKGALSNLGLVIWGNENSLKLGTGRSWEPAEDLDGDGSDDLMLGAPNTEPGGSVFIFAGPLTDAASLTLDDADIRIDSADSSDDFGSTFAVGDLGGDGDPELVVGTSGSSQLVYVFSPNTWF